MAPTFDIPVKVLKFSPSPLDVVKVQEALADAYKVVYLTPDMVEEADGEWRFEAHMDMLATDGLYVKLSKDFADAVNNEGLAGSGIVKVKLYHTTENEKAFAATPFKATIDISEVRDRFVELEIASTYEDSGFIGQIEVAGSNITANIAYADGFIGYGECPRNGRYMDRPVVTKTRFMSPEDYYDITSWGGDRDEEKGGI